MRQERGLKFNLAEQITNPTKPNQIKQEHRQASKQAGKASRRLKVATVLLQVRCLIHSGRRPQYICRDLDCNKQQCPRWDFGLYAHGGANDVFIQAGGCDKSAQGATVLCIAHGADKQPWRLVKPAKTVNKDKLSSHRQKSFCQEAQRIAS